MTRYSLKKNAWPEADSRMWRALTTRVGLLDDGGAGANWANETKRVAERDYGYWLQYLLATEPRALAETPTGRVTLDRVRSYCKSMSDVSAQTRVGRIARLHSIIQGSDPSTDWRWLAKVRRALESAARHEGPVRSKHSRIRSSAHLSEVGLTKLMTADTALDLRPLVRAEQFRDGLIIALLAARPLRIKNFADLRLGNHVRETSDGYSLYVPGKETKTGRPIDTVIPDELVYWLRRYLRIYRPILLSGNRSDHLWVHRGGSGYTAGSLSMRIGALTIRLLGVRLGPHLFRDCAATTIAIEDPAHVMTIAAVLGHSSLKTAEKHYNQARSLEASRRYQRSIGELRERARPLRRRGHG